MSANGISNSLLTCTLPQLAKGMNPARGQHILRFGAVKNRPTHPSMPKRPQNPELAPLPDALKHNRIALADFARPLQEDPAMNGWNTQDAHDYLHHLVAGLAGKSGELTSVLEAMRELDVAHPGVARSHSVAQARAWLVVRTLARSAMGRDILQALYAKRAPSGIAMVMLQAADEWDGRGQRLASVLQQLEIAAQQDLAPDTPLEWSCDPSPHALMNARRSNLQPFALRVWQAAERAMREGEASLDDAQRSALASWRQGYRDDGEDTPLARVKAQVNAFQQRTVPRAGQTVHPIKKLGGAYVSPLNAMPRRAGPTPQATQRREQIKQDLINYIMEAHPGDQMELCTGHRFFVGGDAIALVLTAVSAMLDPSGTFAVAIDPHLQLARDQVVSIRRTHEFTEIHVGTRKELELTGGVGVLMGRNVGLGAPFSARAAGGMLYVGGGRQASHSTGVTVRLTHPSDATQRQGLDDWFRADSGPGATSDPTNWNTLAGNPHLSLSWHEQRHRQHSLGGVVELGASAAADVSSDVQSRAGLGLQASATSYRSRTLSSDQGGTIRSVRVKVAKGVRLNASPFIGASVAVAQTSEAHPMVAIPAWFKDSAISRILPARLARWVRPRSSDTGKATTIELLMRNGKLLPSTSLEVDVASFDSFERLLKGERYLWTPELAARMHGQSPETQDAMVGQARVQLGEFLDRVRQQPRSDQYVLRYGLSASARQDVQTDLALLEQCPAHDARTRSTLERRIAARLEQPGAWQLEEASTQSSTSTARPRRFHFIVEWGAHKRFSETKVTHRLNGNGAWTRPAEPAPPGRPAKPGFFATIGQGLSRLIHR